MRPDNFSIVDDVLHDEEDGDVQVSGLVVSCVLLEMALSFLGILTNLLGECSDEIFSFSVDINNSCDSCDHDSSP